MLNRIVPIGVLSVALAVPAWPCSIAGPIPSPEELVRNAEVIVRARVTGLAEPGPARMFGGGDRQVQFQVLETLKGTLPSSPVTLKGGLEDHSDPNDIDVPYTFVRPGGRRGNCYALGYRRGAEYLLMLRRPVQEPLDVGSGELTPYWAPLSPANEQLARGEDDPWLAWVRRQVGH
jgi:hypothetical protein